VTPSFRRVEFDAYRTDVERLSQEPKSDANVAKLQETQRLYESHRVKYEKLRGDVTVKLQFLHENRVGLHAPDFTVLVFCFLD
jgi:hypothetical protein